jgi:alpha-glucosidase (family GH31 glycosyl hydrolase)
MATRHSLNDKRPSDSSFYQVGATFASPDDEHYYGLGQNQPGFLDHRGHRVERWNSYTATAAPSFHLRSCAEFPNLPGAAWELEEEEVRLRLA